MKPKKLVTVASGGVAPWYQAGAVSPSAVQAVYVPKGAASLAASYVNLKNPGTYDCTAVAAPTFASATGWTFNGSTQYLKTGIAAPKTTLIRFTNGAGAGGGIFGMYTLEGYYYTIVPDSSSVIAYLSGDLKTGSAAPTSGVLGISVKGYLNGAPDTAALTHTFTSSNDLWIGGINFNNALLLPYTCKVQAVAVYSELLDDAQMLAVSRAMESL